jgi:hypothetical protein
MQIEAVTVCIGYADFLAETARHNAGLLDRWVIVTSEEDAATRAVCSRHSLSVLLTEDHKRDEAFAKGRIIERGLQHLSEDAWRLHLDADIVLPSRFRHALESAHLDERCIYGCDRIMVRNWQQWQELQRNGWLNGRFDWLVCPPEGFAVGGRFAGHARGGYVPIGFFQLWHSSADEYQGSRTRPYPVRHGDACRTDVQHALQWDRRQRHLIPELMVAHLESEPAGMGANWKGRKTRPFGPDPVQNQCANYLAPEPGGGK